jgi:alpha-1,2-mannosyltransferase
VQAPAGASQTSTVPASSGPGADPGTAAGPGAAAGSGVPSRWRFARRCIALLLAAALLWAAEALYWSAEARHPRVVLGWFDLNVYNDAGLIVRQLPSILYSWQLMPAVKFTYTPFAALLFAGGSMVPWSVLHWVMTIASIAAVPLTAWLVLGAMGIRGTGRLAAALAVAAVGLWMEPVTKALALGQIELLLMLLIVADLTWADRRLLKGAGIGLAAGIKLVPLLFIPFLLAAGKVRQAAVAAAAFAATVAIGFAVLPSQSVRWWLTGYFMQPGKTGGVNALVNQSLLGMMARAFGGAAAARPIWLAADISIAVIGVTGAALLTRAGKVVPGWVLCAVTAAIVSPISWDHHWVWIVPILAMLAGLAMTGGRLITRCLALFGLGLAVAVFGAWPRYYGGDWGLIPHGLLGWYPPSNKDFLITHLSGWMVLTWNLYVIGGLVILVIMAGAGYWTWLAARRGRAAGRPPRLLSGRRLPEWLRGLRLRGLRLPGWLRGLPSEPKPRA